MANCFICNSEIENPVVHSSGKSIIDCPLCSKFEASERVHLCREGMEEEMLHIYSGALREHETDPSRYFFRDVPTLLASVRVPKNPLEKLDKLLLAIDARSDHFGQELHWVVITDYPLAYATNAEEFYKLLEMATKLEYISIKLRGGGNAFVEIDTNGVRRLIELQTSKTKSNQAFVAMWFNETVEQAYSEGIEPALKATGFEPMLIINKEHNNKIDDEIFAEINKSGLLVADFTGHRPSVYFEAGYAKGLGIPVIFCCREDQIKEAHFDTRQYSHITWSTPEELREKLVRRIEATHRRL